MSKDIVRVREALERSRAAGTGFDLAWTVAMRGVKDGHARAALQGTQWSWALAFDGRVPATNRERAAAALVDLLTGAE